MVGLPETRKKMPAELSGGQRKRVALARAIALNPRVILYDEPTTGLDPIRSDVINELILKLQRELKITSITVTHDMHSAFKIADRIVMLFKGKVIFDGTVDEIKKSDDERIKNFVAGHAGPEDMEGLIPHSVSATDSKPAVDQQASPAQSSSGQEPSAKPSRKAARKQAS
jgi:ABC-type transporter Mla maintaining outer membrane lipid asymmetry ATPase subunit MlaF